MNRRNFLAYAPLLLSVSNVAFASADTIEYTPGLIQEKLAAGETVFVDYSAPWCGTCRRQERVVDELRANNPDYDKAISFIKVDWDTYKSHEVSKSRDIPRRSTLLLLKGDSELGRIVAGTGKNEIQALMDLGLSGS